MKFISLIFFLVIANSILGQSFWSYKERPVVPMSNTYSQISDSITSSNSIPAKSSSRVSSVQKVASNAGGCIDNIDFEFGDFTNWKCYKGTAKTNGTNYVTWSPTTPVAPIANRHQLVSATSLPVNDMYGNFPRLCPLGGKYSLQLGNDNTGGEAEKVSCTFTIPASQNNFQIEYYYAVVFQDPNHNFDQQPRFQAKVYDANNSSNVISCASYDFTAGSGLPGFKNSTVDPLVLYKPWTAVTINLSGYAGHTVILEFTTEDCTKGAHFGYAYVDVSSNCISLIDKNTYCVNTPSITLKAPSGYETYNWYDATFTQLLGTGETLTLSPPPATSTTINVDLIPYLGFGCRDTAYTELKVNPVPVAAFKSDTVVCVGKPVVFTNHSTIPDNTALTYLWNFGDNTTSTSVDNVKTYNSIGNYKVKLATTSINGCMDSIFRNISVVSLPIINPITGSKNICKGQTEVLQNSTPGGIWKALNPAVATISNAGLVTAISPGIDTLRYVVTNSNGCSDSVFFSLKVISNTSSSTSAAICQGDTYLFHGNSYSIPGTYTAHLVNAAGCDSVATLVLTEKLPTGSVTTDAICFGGSYFFNGVSYTTSGTYTTHLINAAGCDSTSTLILQVKMPTSSTTNAAVCQGDSYAFNGITYNTPGTYTAPLINSVGCDSIATLHLTLNLPTASTTNISICTPEFPYSWNGTIYTTGGTYTKTLINAAGCDSVATLVLTEKLIPYSTITDEICLGDSYFFNGTSYTASGTYIHHLNSASGCDSIATLILKVILPTTSITNAVICQGDSYLFNGISYNAAGTYIAHIINTLGCDSIATLNLSVRQPTASTTSASICQGDSYLFNGASYNAAGTFTAHLINAAGCDSTATLNLSLKQPTVSTTRAAICQGDSYLFNGTSYNAPGIYIAHLINAAGCDSIATLNLSMKLSTTSTNNITICQGDSYLFNGTSYNAAGTYIAHLINAAGCDSTATLNLSLKQPTVSTMSVAICQGDSYLFNGISYNAAGTYTAHLMNAVGCDSIATLILKVILPTTSITSAVIYQGDSYLFNGISYNAAGTYTAHIINTSGCDSIATLNLSVRQPTASTTSASICQGDSYLFNGTSYNAPGTYIAHLVNVAGCDSTATLNLSLKQPTASTTNAAICQGDSYLFNGTSYNAAGTYTAHLMNAVGCDSTATLNLSLKLPISSITNVSICQGDSYLFNGASYNAAGMYTAHLINVAGCDSTATLNLSLKQPTVSTTNAAICQGDSYLFNGTSYNAPGFYIAHLINAAGCDSIATLNLSMKLSTTSTNNITICQGDSYLFNGTLYNAAGTYTAHLMNAVGCDSTATLNLSLKLPTVSTTSAAICQGDSYLFNGASYNAAGMYTAHLINAAGCDSTATLNLSLKQPTVSTMSVAICQGDSYLFNGTLYNAAGAYTAHLMNAVGCDSTATLNLSLKQPTASTTNAAICQGNSYLFNGASYNAAGTYTAHLMNAVGCDSTATLNLNLKLPTSSITNAAICQGDSYLFNGASYNAAGTYIAHLMNAVGCDSTATLNLSLKQPTVSTTSAAICQGDSYLFNGTSYNTAGTYIAHLINASGCDSTATLKLSINLPTSSIVNATVCQGDSYSFVGKVYSTTGTYIAHLINAAGCDSTVTLNLTIKYPTTSYTKAEISGNERYYFNGAYYTLNGDYTFRLTNVAGCDSTAHLVLRRLYPTTSTTQKTICSQDLPYVWNGLTFYSAGIQTKRLVNVAGFDSIATLELSVNASTFSTSKMTTCPYALPYVWNGKFFNAAGTYTVRLTNASGCDSIATLILKVKSPLTSTTIDYICTSQLPYYWNKVLYYKTGTYTAQFTNLSGCDSVATLLLTVVYPSTSVTNEAVSSNELPYVWNKLAITESGTYISPIHYVNSLGCDSIAKLILKVNLSTSAITNASVCASELPYIWNGSSYYSKGTYTKTMTNVFGDNVTVTLNLSVIAASATSQSIQLFEGDKYTINGNVYDKEGTYTDILKTVIGCDSTVVTNLSFVSIPNTLTPNGDGHNDVFMKGSRVQIYNRNGILLFEGGDGWDGKYHGSPVSQDTYFYVLYYVSDGKTKSKEGYIMVIR